MLALNKLRKLLGTIPSRDKMPALRFRRFDLQHLLSTEVLCLKMFNPSFTHGEVSTYELFCIGSLVAIFKPRSIFEFGTYQGKTTLNLALNAPDATVYSLDLPVEGFEVNKEVVRYEKDLLIEGKRREVGRYFKDRNADIVQIFSDSMQFDPTKFHERIDFIFIDGSHIRKYVRKDTENALIMLRKGSNKIILWHDFVDKVTTPVAEAILSVPSLAGQVSQLEGTQLGVYVS